MSLLKLYHVRIDKTLKSTSAPQRQIPHLKSKVFAADTNRVGATNLTERSTDDHTSLADGRQTGTSG